MFMIAQTIMVFNRYLIIAWIWKLRDYIFAGTSFAGKTLIFLIYIFVLTLIKLKFIIILLKEMVSCL